MEVTVTSTLAYYTEVFIMTVILMPYNTYHKKLSIIN